jgi:predicted transcriptional regulator
MPGPGNRSGKFRPLVDQRRDDAAFRPDVSSILDDRGDYPSLAASALARRLVRLRQNTGKRVAAMRFRGRGRREPRLIRSTSYNIVTLPRDTYREGILMPGTNQHSKADTLTFRIDPGLKAAFAEIAKEQSRSAGDILREHIRHLVEQKRRRDFAAEAERQSLLVAESSDEAEVMRWIAEIADTEGWK